MDMQNKNEEENKREHGFCKSAGIKTEDIGRLQRRHFYEKTASDIFFCDSPPENNSRESGNDIYLSAGVDTRYNDQNQSESRHFHLSSEDGSTTRNYPDQDEDEQAAEPRESVGRDDCLSEGMDKHNANPKQSDRRHFQLSSEDYKLTSPFANRD